MRGALRIYKVMRTACSMHRRIGALLIAAAVIATPLEVSSAPVAERPPFPRPRPAEAPSRTPAHEPAEKPEPVIDQACLDRLGAAGIDFESITLPAGTKVGCAVDTPVRLKAIKLAPRWRTSIRLPDEPTLACRFGERFGHWLRDLVAPLVRSEEHTSELQSRPHLVCRLLLEKKKKTRIHIKHSKKKKTNDKTHYM